VTINLNGTNGITFSDSTNMSSIIKYKGVVILTSTAGGNWTVPAGVTTIVAHMWGAGGGSANATSAAAGSGNTSLTGFGAAGPGGGGQLASSYGAGGTAAGGVLNITGTTGNIFGVAVPPPMVSRFTIGGNDPSVVFYPYGHAATVTTSTKPSGGSGGYVLGAGAVTPGSSIAYTVGTSGTPGSGAPASGNGVIIIEMWGS